jgi:hypothetical protein
MVRYSYFNDTHPFVYKYLNSAGWSALHHAALLAPPTLVSHLLTRGSSPFAVTRRNLTALDIVTAHSLLPGREDVRVLLEEAMREKGWTGGRMEERRRLQEMHEQKLERQKVLQDQLTRILDIDHRWWGDSDAEIGLDDVSEIEDEESKILSVFVSGFFMLM